MSIERLTQKKTEVGGCKNKFIGGYYYLLNIYKQYNTNITTALKRASLLDSLNFTEQLDMRKPILLAI